MIYEMKETDLGLLPESWDLQILGDLLYIKGRIGWKGLKKSEYLEEGYAIINGEQIISDKVNWNFVGRISKERFLESPEIILKRKDILMTKDGTIGKIAYVDHLPEDATVASGVFVIRKDSKLLHTKYLYNFFKSRYFKWLIKGRTEGSVIPHLYQRDFKEMMIPLPSFEEQKAIAKVLTAFDDKIELLQAQNKTLEAMAQTIFNEWFGKYQIGDELPEGWRVDSIDNLINIIIDYRGKTPKKLGMDWSNKGIEALSAKTIKNGKIVRRDAMNLGSKELYSIWMKDELQKGDILLTSEAPLGEMYYLPDDTKYILSQRLFALRVNESITSEYLYHYLFSKYGQHLLKARSSGSTVEGIRQSELRKVEVIIPEVNILNKASSIFKSTFIKTAANEKQIQYLTKTRDTLLPKLMSGQVRVKNIKQTEDA